MHASNPGTQPGCPLPTTAIADPPSPPRLSRSSTATGHLKRHLPSSPRCYHPNALRPASPTPSTSPSPYWLAATSKATFQACYRLPFTGNPEMHQRRPLTTTAIPSQSSDPKLPFTDEKPNSILQMRHHLASGSPPHLPQAYTLSMVVDIESKVRYSDISNFDISETLLRYIYRSNTLDMQYRTRFCSPSSSIPAFSVLILLQANVAGYR